MKRSMTPELLALCASLALLSWGCQEGSLARECEPSDQVGCSEGERCTLNELGTPSCRPSNPAGATQGEHCEQSEGCADGLACISLLGVPQCAQFCALDQGQAAADAQCATRSPYARCLAALPTRIDIGVCLTACDPFNRGGELAACDVERGSVCGVSVDLPFLTCIPEGDRRAYEPCDSSAGCERGGVCLREGAQQRCVRPLSPGDECPAEQLKRTAYAYHDPLSDGPITACWPSVSIAQSFTSDVSYRLTLSVHGALEERRTACAEWGGELATLSSMELLNSLSAPLSQVGAELRGPQADEEPPPFGVWVAGEAAAGACLIERVSSATSPEASSFSLSAEGCDPSWPTLCSISAGLSLP